MRYSYGPASVCDLPWSKVALVRAKTAAASSSIATLQARLSCATTCWVHARQGPQHRAAARPISGGFRPIFGWARPSSRWCRPSSSKFRLLLTKFGPDPLGATKSGSAASNSAGCTDRRPNLSPLRGRLGPESRSAPPPRLGRATLGQSGGRTGVRSLRTRATTKEDKLGWTTDLRSGTRGARRAIGRTSGAMASRTSEVFATSGHTSEGLCGHAVPMGPMFAQIRVRNNDSQRSPPFERGPQSGFANT